MSTDAVSDAVSALSDCSWSPRSRKSNDKEEEILIDFTTPPELSQNSPPISDPVPAAATVDAEILLAGPIFTSIRPFDGITFGKSPKKSEITPPASDTALTDDVEILLTGPNETSTWPSNGRTVGEIPEHTHTTPTVADTAAGDDKEILLVGPNFTATQPLLHGGKFGEFSLECTRLATNPFLVDILASSSAGNAVTSNGIGLSMAESSLPHDRDGLIPVNTDTGTELALKRSPFAGRECSPLFDQCETSFTTRRSPGSADGASFLSSFRPHDITSRLSPHESALSQHGLAISAVPAAASPVMMFETNLDDSMSPTLTSPVAFVVSCSMLFGRRRKRVCG